jgi:hypothetical protein
MIANLLLSVVGFLLTVNPTSAPSPDYKVLAPIRTETSPCFQCNGDWS